MKITVLIENTKPSDDLYTDLYIKNELIAEHGLSFFIEYNGKKILLDAGSSDAFLSNAEQLQVKLEETEYCLLSHGHYDHSTGFSRFYEKIAQPDLYGSELVDKAYYSGTNENLHYIGLPAEAIEVWKKHGVSIVETTQITEGVWAVPHNTAGLERIGESKKLFKKVGEDYFPDDFSHEISYVFELEKGLVIFNSCSHGGISNILNEVHEAIPEKRVIAFVGGLHMKGKCNGIEICTFSEQEIDLLCEKIVDTGIEKIYTGHCTGSVGLEILKQKLGDRMIPITTGSIIEF